MKTNTINIIVMILIFSLLLTGCIGPGPTDYEVSLPGEYALERTSAHLVSVSKKYDPVTHKADSDFIAIPAKVTHLASNESFILAKQVDLILDPKSRSGYEIPDEDSYHYWIIIVESNEVIGPLNDESFKDKKNELKIPKELELINVTLREILSVFAC